MEGRNFDLEKGRLSEESVEKESWNEPELDSEDERVISMYDGIRKILKSQRQTTQPRTGSRKTQVKNAATAGDAMDTLKCGRILKVDVEPNLAVITVEKLNGERRQLRIEARLG